jgi:hypothetical protein
LTSGKIIQRALYADDQDTRAKSDEKLQMAVNEVNKINKKYEMKL